MVQHQPAQRPVQTAAQAGQHQPAQRPAQTAAQAEANGPTRGRRERPSQGSQWPTRDAYFAERTPHFSLFAPISTITIHSSHVFANETLYKTAVWIHTLRPPLLHSPKQSTGREAPAGDQSRPGRHDGGGRRSHGASSATAPAA